MRTDLGDFNEFTQHTIIFLEDRKDILEPIKIIPVCLLSGIVINHQWFELPMSKTIFHGPKDVRGIDVRLFYS